MGLIAFILIGLVAGLIARAIIPGPQSMGLVATTLLGMVGSIIGGLIGSVLGGRGQGLALTPSGLILSTLGAIVVLLIVSWVRSPRARA
jgi:uncharacterized membrane protein YeaQ/YmgE (transglycosylase-associated protein family)